MSVPDPSLGFTGTLNLLYGEARWSKLALAEFVSKSSPESVFSNANGVVQDKLTIEKPVLINPKEDLLNVTHLHIADDGVFQLTPEMIMNGVIHVPGANAEERTLIMPSAQSLARYIDLTQVPLTPITGGAPTHATLKTFFEFKIVANGRVLLESPEVAAPANPTIPSYQRYFVQNGTGTAWLNAGPRIVVNDLFTTGNYNQFDTIPVIVERTSDTAAPVFTLVDLTI